MENHMFDNTLDIDINSVTKTFVRVSEANGTSKYVCKEDDQRFTLNLRVSNYIEKSTQRAIDRYNAELITEVYPTATDLAQKNKAYLTFEAYSTSPISEVEHTPVALTSFLSNATIGKLLNGEV
jgi:hypothetical protein